ncbi:hypothetical protein D3C81_2113010 [compost metagenome]
MVAPAGEGQQGFGQRVHGVAQQQGAQLFGQRRAAGLAREQHVAALGAERFGHFGDVRGLARAINAFE